MGKESRLDKSLVVDVVLLRENTVGPKDQPISEEARQELVDLAKALKGVDQDQYEMVQKVISFKRITIRRRDNLLSKINRL
jgi:hypothetical protein